LHSILKERDAASVELAGYLKELWGMSEQFEVTEFPEMNAPSLSHINILLNKPYSGKLIL